MTAPHVFGIRHLSPAGAWYVREYLDEMKPELVLIEGPSDFTELIEELGGSKVKPPIAVMAYTQELPIRTILYPFSNYSPEYQAILWAREHRCRCRFCDLPSDVFLGISKNRDVKESRDNDESVYKGLDRMSEDGDHETFWERTIEHAADFEGYQKGAAQFGRSLRELTLSEVTLTGREKSKEQRWEDAENLVREAYMRGEIKKAVEEGIPPEKIVVITGAFHVEGILGRETFEDEISEWKRLPRLETKKTLMPYSYYRLSERSGYGAGNRAPAYYELLWKGLCLGKPDYASGRYLTSLAVFQRKHGNMASSAQVIEAMRLARSLAELRGYEIPALKDLRDAAVTCMGHGNFSEIVVAAADTEIGTTIGSLPQGVSQTSIQTDFYRKLEELRLEKYKSLTAERLSLDLREKLTVRSRKSAFMDLERSFFLHRLRVLNIRFASLEGSRQENATWAENWLLQWTPEAEIQIVEAVLKGDTVEQAAGFELKTRIEENPSISGLAAVVEEACYCGIPQALSMAVSALQKSAVDSASIIELADTAMSLSVVIRYGDIRKLDRTPLLPLLSQLFLRSSLILAEECICDDQAAGNVGKAINLLNDVVLNHDFLDEERWLRILSEIASRDDLNTRLSGLAAAVLLERGQMASEELGREVERRLSRGIPAELGAGWFEGLSMKNHYALIARMTLWEKLSGYLDTLSEEEFKRALVFLRRAFADFSAEEKDRIAENLGEIWEINPGQVSEVLNGVVDLEEEGAMSEAGQGDDEGAELLEGLEEFDFDDL
ncbi:MAG: hypothetical protein HFG65_04370 [Hungatella sp.]|nr:hypothetical protein [Hungatella sp.]